MTPSPQPRCWSGHLLAVWLGTAVGCALGGAVLIGAGWTPEPVRPPRQQVDPEQQRQAALDALAERVGPQPAARPFDRAQLHVVSATTPEAELEALRAELLDLVGNLERGAIYATWVQSQDLSERLALFPWRFGAAPAEVEGWEPLAASASRTLARMDGRTGPALRTSKQDSYAQLLRALLLELAGQTDEAATALANVTVQHFCGNCSAERRHVVDRRRSEAAERRGDRTAALALLEGTLGDPFGFGSVVDAADPVSCTRAALLYAQSGREAETVLLLQLVVDLRPATPSAEVARGVLVQMGALIEPTAERLQTHYIDPTVPDPQAQSWSAERRQRQLAIEALGRLGGEAAFERLSAFWDGGDTGALAGLVELCDERARPLFERVIAQGDAAQFELALRGLQALDGGARDQVEPMLRRLADPERDYSFCDDVALDAQLRAVCGGGPSLDSFDRLRDEEFAQAWLDWLRTADTQTRR